MPLDLLTGNINTSQETEQPDVEGNADKQSIKFQVSKKIQEN